MLRDVKVISPMLRRLNVTEMIGTIATNDIKQPLQSQKLNLPFVAHYRKGDRRIPVNVKYTLSGQQRGWVSICDSTRHRSLWDLKTPPLHFTSVRCAWIGNDRCWGEHQRTIIQTAIIIAIVLLALGLLSEKAGIWRFFVLIPIIT